MPSEAEPLPDELKIPIAVADDLLDAAAGVSSSTPDGQESKEPEQSSASPERSDEPAGVVSCLPFDVVRQTLTCPCSNRVTTYHPHRMLPTRRQPGF